jgi:hypothetical protein
MWSAVAVFDSFHRMMVMSNALAYGERILGIVRWSRWVRGGGSVATAKINKWSL